MKYEVLLFDADGTLFDFDKAEEYALLKAMETFGFEYRSDVHLQLYREINKVIWQELEAGLITAQELKPERFRRFFQSLNISVNLEEFSTCYLDGLSLGSQLFSGVNDLLADLNHRYQLVLITNGIAKVQYSRLERAGIADYFHAIVISEEVGASKPNPDIFAYALREIGHLDKGTALIVGDSLSADIQGGRNFGIDTCWYNPAKLQNTTRVEPTYQISDFVELYQILEEDVLTKRIC